MSFHAPFSLRFIQCVRDRNSFVNSLSLSESVPTLSVVLLCREAMVFVVHDAYNIVSAVYPRTVKKKRWEHAHGLWDIKSSPPASIVGWKGNTMISVTAICLSYDCMTFSELQRISHSPSKRRFPALSPQHRSPALVIDMFAFRCRRVWLGSTSQS